MAQFGRFPMPKKIVEKCPVIMQIYLYHIDMSKAIIETAKNLGTKAYGGEKMRVPGWDSALMEMVAQATGSKNKCALMAAWLRGWDTCLAADMMAA